MDFLTMLSEKGSRMRTEKTLKPVTMMKILQLPTKPVMFLRPRKF